MPIYEYKCDACGQRMEAFQKMAEEPLKVCEQCGKSALRKLVSAAAFKLTGTGWYETDFKNSGSEKSAKEHAAKNAAKGEAGKDGAAETSSSKQESGDKAASSDKKTPTKSPDKTSEASTSKTTAANKD
ncbi:MAG: FmdB family zinc ribbon protein [Candidatus Eutrophobiaceae bacterium]